MLNIQDALTQTVTCLHMQLSDRQNNCSVFDVGTEITTRILPKDLRFFSHPNMTQNIHNV